MKNFTMQTEDQSSEKSTQTAQAQMANSETQTTMVKVADKAIQTMSDIVGLDQSLH